MGNPTNGGIKTEIIGNLIMKYTSFKFSIDYSYNSMKSPEIIALVNPLLSPVPKKLLA